MSDESSSTTTTSSPFLFLSLTLPPSPLFPEKLLGSANAAVIPQVSLLALLSKFDGQHQHNVNIQTSKTHILTKLPPVLVFQIPRFTLNEFKDLEKNPTLVSFPLTDLDMAPFVKDYQVDVDVSDVSSLSVTELLSKAKDLCMKMETSDRAKYHKKHQQITLIKEKDELRSAVTTLINEYNHYNKTSSLYDLVSSVVPIYETKEQDLSYYAHVKHLASNVWYAAEVR